MARGRRGNNEGSIARRSDGRWHARLSLPNGRRKSLYGSTRQEVAAKLAAAQRDLENGLPIAGEKQTVAQYLATWLETARPTLKPRTFMRYECVVRLHIVPSIGSLRLARLSAQQLQHLYATKITSGMTPGSAGFMHAVLHRALGAAYRLGLVPRNVADLVTKPRVRSREMQPLTPKQAQTFLAAATGDPLEALYVLAVTTGMRIGEILALTWHDVDLDMARLTVRHTLIHLPQQRWMLTEPKTKRSRRRIDLTRNAVEALRTHRVRQLAQRLALGEAWQDHDFVFTRGDGEPLRATSVLKAEFRPLLQRAGLPPIRLHDLRHTAATLLLVQGVHVKVVSELLGHSTVSITLDRYSHVLPTLQRDAATAMERALAVH